jgi:hypothetical protein
MAQISETLYKDIADSYAAIQLALSGVQNNARAALNAIVDIDTLTYPPENPSDPDADAALEVELSLLQTFNAAYVAAGNVATSTASLLDAVSAVNDFVITNTSGTNTATEKLKAWINTSMAGYWTSSYCPDGWASFSQDAGYNILGWNTVSDNSGITDVTEY